MKLVVLSLFMFSTLVFAQSNVLTTPKCYVGTFESESGTVPVTLVFEKNVETVENGNLLYRVNYFVFGSKRWSISGFANPEQRNVVQFNNNDDYPASGRNDIRNEDIELIFTSSGATGMYAVYTDSEHGGFGYGAATGTLVSEGYFKLRKKSYNCPYIIPAKAAPSEPRP